MNKIKVFKLLSMSTLALLSATSSFGQLAIKSEGRKPQNGLKYRQAGVPVFELIQKQGQQVIRVQNIPQLDIGQEKEIVATSFQVQIPKARTSQVIATTNKPSPPLLQVPQEIQLLPVSEQAKIVKDTTKIEPLPLVKALEFIPEPVVNEPQTTLTNLVEIKPEEYKMIQALIFLDYKQRYDLAMPLFVELMDVPAYKDQATFHYAETALGLKLFSEFREKMLQVTKTTKNIELQKMALEMVVKNIKHLEISDIQAIDPLVTKFDINTISYPQYLLKKAKYHSNKNELAQFEEALLLIPSTAPEYKEGSLLKAVFNYRTGQVDAALTELETLWPTIEEKKKDQIRNLTALTLARLYFQKGEYKEAYKYYIQVDKSSGQWLQSMVESAWTQVLAGDNEGAAGNMFSLHTDFFKKAYAPETYIVRTVGYLNLCQYGDGMSVLDDLNKKYKTVFDQLSQFKDSHKNSIDYYDLVKAFLKTPTADTIEGLPRAFVVELARHPAYINYQKQINNYEDENSRFNKLTIDLIKKEREARLAMLKSKNEFLAAQRNGKKGAELSVFEKKYLAFGVEHVIYSRAKDGIKKMREAAIARLTKEEDNLRLKASENLMNRYNEFVATLDHLVDQKEVLSYEIYSGAGEHIRFQMAGGEIKEGRSQASLNPTDKENYQWKFKGEVWEDELGHYRSSLKNVCPKEEVASTPVE